MFARIAFAAIAAFAFVLIIAALIVAVEFGPVAATVTVGIAAIFGIVGIVGMARTSQA